MQQDPENDEAFYRAIEAKPEDEEAWGVFADWLQARGDLRGTLMALEAAEPTEEDARVVVKAFVEAHKEALLGELAKLPVWITFRRGHADWMVVPTRPQAAKALRLAASAPATRLLRQLTIHTASKKVLPPLKALLVARPVRVLHIGYTGLADLEVVTPCARLQLLNARHTKITDLAPLADKMELQSLAITGTVVADLTPLEGLPLRELVISKCKRLRSIAALESCTTLEEIDLRGSGVSDLAPLLDLPRLKRVRTHREQGTPAQREALEDRLD